MRLIVTTLVLALGACGSESQPQQRAGQAAPTAAAGTPTTGGGGAGQSTPLMAIPEEPEALKRLEAMGYTVHEEQGHLHAPGVNSCPAMGDGPAM